MPSAAKGRLPIRAASLLGAIALAATAQPVLAAPAPSLGGLAPQQEIPALGASIVKDETRDGVRYLTVKSVALGKDDVTVQVLAAGADNAPTLLLLDGANPVKAGVSDWLSKTADDPAVDIVKFFAGKGVNVILPGSGKSSYYTDWLNPDPVLGAAKWETFLMSELLPLMKADLKANDRVATAGLSMGGLAAANLVTHHPDAFVGFASYSGVLAPSAPTFAQQIAYSISDTSPGADPVNMWGPLGGPGWVNHDPSAMADALHGKAIYVSSSAGWSGQYDQNLIGPITTNFVGSIIEMASLTASQIFTSTLTAKGIPATTNYQLAGTHSWPYWALRLQESWPVLAGALGQVVTYSGVDIPTQIADSAARGALGNPVGGTFDLFGAVSQNFDIGTVYSAAGTAYFTRGIIDGTYDAINGPAVLGLPVSDEVLIPGGAISMFRNGALVFVAPLGAAFPIGGAFWNAWNLAGGANSALGLPTSAEFSDNGITTQTFERGRLTFVDGTVTQVLS